MKYCFVVLWLLYSNLALANPEIDRRSNQILDVMVKGNYEQALNLTEELINDFPNSLKANYMMLRIQVNQYQLIERIYQPTEIQKKQIAKMVGLIKIGLQIIDENPNLPQQHTAEYLNIYAYQLSIFQEDKLAVELFEKSNYLENYISHPTYKYSASKYAESLAHIGRKAESHKIYLKSLIANNQEVWIIQDYLVFNNNFEDPNKTMDLASGYMKKNGFHYLVKVEWCRVYERYNSVSQALTCFNELLSMKDEYVSPEIIKYASDYVAKHNKE